MSASASLAAIIGPSIAVGLFTLIGAFGGAAFANRHSSFLATEARTEARRTALRTELSTLVVEVSSLVDSAMLSISFYSVAKLSDIMEWVNTDTGKDQARRGQQIQTTISNLSLMVGDAELLAALADLERCIHDWPEQVNGPALEVAKKGGNKVEAFASGMVHVRKTRTALSALVLVANPLVQIPISLQPTRRWWQR